MALTITELRAGFAARVEGVDLTRPVDNAVLAAIQAAIDHHGVLVFPGQCFDDASQVAFSRRLGPLETSIRAQTRGAGQLPQISYLANVSADGQTLAPTADRNAYDRGNEFWHTDSSFKPVPAKYSLLSGREVPPEGGETEFADVRAAYEAWPGWADAQGAIGKADLEGLICEHSIVYSRKVLTGYAFSAQEEAALPTVRHLLVRRHPASGRQSFYVASHASHVVQWPRERGRALLDHLIAWSTQSRFVYTHRWQAHDLVMWDNRSVLHRGRPFDRGRYRRVMHRTTVAGDGPTVPADSPWALPAGEPAMIRSTHAVS